MTVKNPKVGMIYHVINRNEELIGILLSMEKHPGMDCLYYSFYTTENTTYEAYSQNITLESGVSVKESVRKLMKEYYQLQTKMKELEQQQKIIDEQKGVIWAEERKISSKLDSINGITDNIDWITVMHQPEEPDPMKEKLHSVAENVVEVTDNVRKSWVGQTLYDKLNNFFDSLWTYLDSKKENYHISNN